MRRECCTLSLILDTGNFNALYIDGKVVNKMFFNGEKIYDATKWFAIGYKYTSTKIDGMWGNASKKLCCSTDTNAKPTYCIGNTASRNAYCCETNETYSEFTDLGAIIKLNEAFNYLPISNFSECENVYYVTRFKQTTYDGDLLIKPFIKLSVSINTRDQLLGNNILGVGNKSADSTDEGFSFAYPSSYKGKTAVHKTKLSDGQVQTLDFYKNTSKYPYFLCKAFKTDDSTTATTATAYYGGYLLLEV